MKAVFHIIVCGAMLLALPRAARAGTEARTGQAKVSQPMMVPEGPVHDLEEAFLRREGPAAAPKDILTKASSPSPSLTTPADFSSQINLPSSSKSQKNSAPSRIQIGKSQGLALVLAIFFGVFGIHRFYLGYIGIGLIQMLTLGGLGVWFIVDAIRIGRGKLKPIRDGYASHLGKSKSEE